ncbi:hypothetical protein [Intestinibaculum porci]|uniref:hypothetical protein n=1 Tax=Intestinibaculum porci TaxID=2487118 RepID=UPI002409C21B|nr:hypothetical protein [Intestinibaculum porci]MDD6349048.1 hypothetical protein [Intestinibaculum porci]
MAIILALGSSIFWHRRRVILIRPLRNMLSIVIKMNMFKLANVTWKGVVVEQNTEQAIDLLHFAAKYEALAP